MKHVFIVFSNFHFLIAKQYVIDQNISIKDSVLILNRNMTFPKGYENIFSNIYNYPEDFFHGKSTRMLPSCNIIKGFSNIHKFENMLRDFIIDDDFIFYTSNTACSDYLSVLYTECRCKGYYLLEDGTASYIAYNNSPIVKNIFSTGVKKALFNTVLNSLFKRFYYLRNNYVATENNKYTGTIASSENAFPDFPRKRIVISCPFNVEVSGETCYDAVLSIDNLPQYFNYGAIEELYSILNEHFHKQGYKNKAYKFHPNFFSNINDYFLYKKLVINIFGNNMVEIERNVILENLLISSHAVLYSDFSSVGFYPAQYGVKCISYYSLLAHKNAKYDNVYGKIPEIVKHLYEPIKI